VSVVVALYFLIIGSAPLIQSVSTTAQQGSLIGQALNTERISRDVFVNPDAAYVPGQGALEAFRYFGLPVVAAWLLGFARLGVHPWACRAGIGLIALLTMMTGQRWPLLYLATVLAVAYALEGRGRVPARRLFGLAAPTLLGVLVLSALLGRWGDAGSQYSISAGLAGGAGEFGERVIFGNAEVPFLSYGPYGERPPLMGESWLQNLAAYLPGAEPSFPVLFHAVVVGPSGATAPPDFATEAFINFRWGGVILLSLIWGILLARWDSYAREGHHDLRARGPHAMITVALGFSAVSGASFAMSAAATAGVMWVAAVALDAIVWPQRAAHVDPIAA
jgi:hypothetical protein